MSPDQEHMEFNNHNNLINTFGFSNTITIVFRQGFIQINVVYEKPLFRPNGVLEI